MYVLENNGESRVRCKHNNHVEPPDMPIYLLSTLNKPTKNDGNILAFLSVIS